MAAALIAIDRFGGLSSAWMRCITTAQQISHEQHVFRLDWSQLRTVASLSQPPKLQDLTPLFERLRAFAIKHDEVIETETRTWIAEFRSILSELGRAPKREDGPAPLPASSSLTTNRTGSIDLTIEGDAADGDIIVDVTGVKQPATRAMKLKIDNVAPGFQRISATGTIGGLPAIWDTIVDVPAGATVAALAKRR